jgi:uncharacterized protein
MEREGTKRQPLHTAEVKHWDAFLFLVRIFRFLLIILGLYKKGQKNALALETVHHQQKFKNLPAAFEKTRILHLSDLHIDGMPELLKILKKQLREIGPVDFCVFTGDYGVSPLKSEDPNHPMVSDMKEILECIDSTHPPIGILGNHDSAHTVSLFNELGIKMLVNQKLQFEKDGEVLQFVGTDDVHYFYGPQSLKCLEHCQEHFTVGLIHSPELFDFAAEAGVDFYLAGHTHGGQIRFFNRPLITHLDRGKQYSAGNWKYRQMKGHTSVGVGTSGIPVRYGVNPQILVHQLIREES